MAVGPETLIFPDSAIQVEMLSETDASWLYTLSINEEIFVLKIPKNQKKFIIEVEQKALSQISAVGPISINNYAVTIRPVSNFGLYGFNQPQDPFSSPPINNIPTSSRDMNLPVNPGLLMEHLEGYKSLEKFLEMHPNLKSVIIFSIIKYIEESVIQKGVTNRDLKPDNFQIKLESDGSISIVLIDFSLSTIKDSFGRIQKFFHPNQFYGSPITAYPPNISNKPGTIEDIFEYEVKCTKWSLLLTSFWAYFGIYPFKNSGKILDIQELSQFMLTDVLNFLGSICKKSQIVSWDECKSKIHADRFSETDKKVYDFLIEKILELLPEC